MGYKDNHFEFKDLKDYHFRVYKGYGEEEVEIRGEIMDRSLDLIDSAVAKQITEEKIVDNLSFSGYRCPKCDRPVWRDEQYCSHCGQRLNLIGEEEDPISLSKEEEADLFDLVNSI